MEHVVMERVFNLALQEHELLAMAQNAADCASLYRVTWLESFLSEDGGRLVCCFEAPDCEALRMMTRDDGAASKKVWAGSAHDTSRDLIPNVLVERRFDEPVTLESLQSIEDGAAWCLDTHRVTFLRTYFSSDGKTMFCLYHAPDAESVRRAQQQAGMPMDRVWSCRRYTPESLAD